MDEWDDLIDDWTDNDDQDDYDDYDWRHHGKHHHDDRHHHDDDRHGKHHHDDDGDSDSDDHTGLSAAGIILSIVAYIVMCTICWCYVSCANNLFNATVRQDMLISSNAPAIPP